MLLTFTTTMRTFNIAQNTVFKSNITIVVKIVSKKYKVHLISNIYKIFFERQHGSVTEKNIILKQY